MNTPNPAFTLESEFIENAGDRVGEVLAVSVIETELVERLLKEIESIPVVTTSR